MSLRYTIRNVVLPARPLAKINATVEGSLPADVLLAVVAQVLCLVTLAACAPFLAMVSTSLLLPLGFLWKHKGGKNAYVNADNGDAAGAAPPDVLLHGQQRRARVASR